MTKFTNYTVKLTAKDGTVTYHDFFVASREQARDYAKRKAIEMGVMWPLGHCGFAHGYELYAKVNPT